MEKRDRNQRPEVEEEGGGAAATTGAGYGPGGEVYGARNPGAGEAGSDRKEWPEVPSDWPRQMPEAEEEQRRASSAPPDADAREEDEEAVADASKSDLGPPAHGQRTQTGTGSTSGRS
jgi:hypothetical protein